MKSLKSLNRILSAIRILSVLLIGVTLGGILILPQLAFAEDQPTQFNATDHNSDESLNVKDVLSADGQTQTYLTEEGTPVVNFILDIINFITRVLGAVAIVLIIIGGLMMIVSEGEENRLEKGKTIFTSAIIGLVIVMFSYIVVRFVQSLFYLQ